MTDFVVKVDSDSIGLSYRFQEIFLINSPLRILILWRFFFPLLGKLIENPFKDVRHFLSQ